MAKVIVETNDGMVDTDGEVTISLKIPDLLCILSLLNSEFADTVAVRQARSITYRGVDILSRDEVMHILVNYNPAGLECVLRSLAVGKLERVHPPVVRVKKDGRP